MAHKELLVLGLLAATWPVAASRPDPVPPTAPVGGPETRYCLRVEPQTGSRIESIECWTRDEWAAADVDVDKEWPKEGVRVIGS